ELELRSATGRMRVQLPSMARQIPDFLLKARIRATGIAQAVRTADGGRVAGELLLPDLAHIGLLSVPSQLWNNLPLTEIGRIPSIDSATEFVRTRGEVQSIERSAGRITISEGTNTIVVESIGRLPEKPGVSLEIVGRVNRSKPKPLLQWAVFR